MKQMTGHAFPFLFTSAGELDGLTVGDGRYPMSKIALRIALRHPGRQLAVMVRGCDERALLELFRNRQLDPAHIVPVGIACSVEQGLACRCPKPYPSDIVLGEARESIRDLSDIRAIEAMPLEERFSFWTDQLGKCIKCYGCRNICPVCFCSTCTLQDAPLVTQGEIPAAVPSFHLARAFHMAGRCIDCGLCEEGCPVHIPLRTLYRKVIDVVRETFDYVPGEQRATEPPLEALGDGSFALREHKLA
jgi:ferredoxin